MKTFVLFTPTYNRGHLLPRLYKSLCLQEFKDFEWIIIDDGSNDNTKFVVDQFINDNILDIKYFHKPNGGKHTAFVKFRSLVHLSDYKYFICIDSDDELVPNALSVFFNEWENIDNSGEDLDIIKARTCLFNKPVPKHRFFNNIDYRDEFYQDVTYKYKMTYEMCTSIRMSSLDVIYVIPPEFWLSDKVKFYPENIIWLRAGKTKKIRFLNRVVRIVHQDAGNQLTKSSKVNSVNNLYNYIVGIRYWLPENLESYLRYDLIRFFKELVLYGAMCEIVKIPYKEYSKQLDNAFLAFMLIVVYPMVLFAILFYQLKHISE